MNVAALGRIWPDAKQASLKFYGVSKAHPVRRCSLKTAERLILSGGLCCLGRHRWTIRHLLIFVQSGDGEQPSGANPSRGSICIDGLRHAALRASKIKACDLCAFEIPVIERLASIHSADQLARFHKEFVTNATKAERLYLDFPRFLERHLTKIYEKSLP